MSEDKHVAQKIGPCARCGSKKTCIEYNGDTKKHFLSCRECFFVSPSSITHFEAVYNWNKANTERRAIACVNACEGIPTEALEGGVVGELLRKVRCWVAFEDSGDASQDEYYAAIDAARAAIAKAEGGE